MGRGESKKKVLSVEGKLLGGWDLLHQFLEGIDRHLPKDELHLSWSSKNRKMSLEQYLGLMLFGLINPCINTMRSLVANSHLLAGRIKVCNRPVSLGSFSEAQTLFNAELLEGLIKELGHEVYLQQPLESRSKQPLIAIDSTLMRALPRMTEAVWRTQYKVQNAIRATVQMRVQDQAPLVVAVSEGRACERREFGKCIIKGAWYVGDRNFGCSYDLIRQLESAKCKFTLRMHEKSVRTTIKEFELSAEDLEAGVLSDSLVELGRKPCDKCGPYRLVHLLTPDGEPIWIITNFLPDEMSAVLVATAYKHRWKIELFFRWMKYLLKSRHWMAESSKGTKIQVYLVMIAALLLSRLIGKLPTKRQMELLQLYMIGFIGPQELQDSLFKKV